MSKFNFRYLFVGAGIVTFVAFLSFLGISFMGDDNPEVNEISKNTENVENVENIDIVKTILVENETDKSSGYDIGESVSDDSDESPNNTSNEIEVE